MKLEQWLTNICKTETPDKSIVAYWFGMFESDTYTLYLVGSNEYTPDDDDWACNADFVPREKYRALAGKGYSRLAWEDLLEKVKGELTDFMKTETFKTSFCGCYRYRGGLRCWRLTPSYGGKYESGSIIRNS